MGQVAVFAEPRRVAIAEGADRPLAAAEVRL